ncbi:Non-heme 11 kDa protein of cytochrome bc1 complex [Meredithblackwellia eburnea MCA 4105]
MFSSFFEAVADLLPTAHAEEAAAPSEVVEDKAADKEEEEPAEEEEEEEEPEDVAPAIREECEQAHCKSFKHHFEECAERINNGNTHIDGETCVEELFHLMHCVEHCAAPKIFAKLK